MCEKKFYFMRFFSSNTALIRLDLKKIDFTVCIQVDKNCSITTKVRRVFSHRS